MLGGDCIMTSKGIVLGKHKNKCIVLTTNGVFKTLSITKPVEVGEEIFWEEKSRESVFSWKSYIAMVVAASIFFVIAFNFLNPLKIGPLKAAAYVAYELNPGIEMSINQKGKVLTAEGLNEEGKLIVNSVSLLNKNIEKAVMLITEQAIALGYFNINDNFIVISMTNLDEANDFKKNFTDEISKTVQKVAQKKMVEVTVETIQVEKEDRENAKQEGLLPGSFVISETAKEKGFSISKDELKQKGIGKVLKDKGINVKEIIKETKEKANKSKKSKDELKNNQDKQNNKENNNKNLPVNNSNSNKSNKENKNQSGTKKNK